MKSTAAFSVNEIFYSLQGEGYFAGTPAAFVRLAGCNLRCPFCDTDHRRGNPMTAREIAAAVSAYPATHTVLTGGEPSLWATEELIAALSDGGRRFVAIETNGTRPLPGNADWITLSPKDGIAEGAKTVIEECDELKVVYRGQDLSAYDRIRAAHRFLQPCDSGDAAENAANLRQTVQACLDDPRWRLSLQTHKLINIR